MRRETSPEDIRGMHATAGVLTERGGMTSHAAVIGRGRKAGVDPSGGPASASSEGGCCERSMSAGKPPLPA